MEGRDGEKEEDEGLLATSGLVCMPGEWGPGIGVSLWLPSLPGMGVLGSKAGLLPAGREGEEGRRRRRGRPDFRKRRLEAADSGGGIRGARESHVEEWARERRG